MSLVTNLKNINSQADLFNYICQLEEDIEAKEKIIDSQILKIADLATENDALTEKVKKLTAALEEKNINLEIQENRFIDSAVLEDRALDSVSRTADFSKVY